jgi:uncharacterized protein
MMINDEKYKSLLQWMGALPNAAVAFSGGVDSTFVLVTAQKVLGNRALAFTVKTPYIPDWEMEEAIAFCKERKIQHRIIEAGILDEIRHNPENRCYLCKKHVFNILKTEAAKEGIDSVLDGTNADDTGVYRPGLAALRELEVRSPLLENGITKTEVRAYSKILELPTADKPSYACLLTRLPYHTEVIPAELMRIEKAERCLAALGYGASRVRHYGSTARIELEKARIAEFIQSGSAEQVVQEFHNLGYQFITLDLEGYRTGSFDRHLTKSDT